MKPNTGSSCRAGSFRLRIFASLVLYSAALPSISCERASVGIQETEPSQLQCRTETGQVCVRPPIHIEIREGTFGSIASALIEARCVLDRETFVYTIRNVQADLRYLDVGVPPHVGPMFATPSNERAARTLQLCLITWGKEGLSTGYQFPLRVQGGQSETQSCSGRQVFIGSDWSNVVKDADRSPEGYTVQMRILSVR
jgi:hypothetical protein